MPATSLFTTALTGGIALNPYHSALGALPSLAAWFGGGLSRDGHYLERMNGRPWAAINTPPMEVTVGSRKVLQFAGLGGLKAVDGENVLASATTFSIVTLIRATDTAGGGGALVAGDITAAYLLDYVLGNNGTHGFFSENGNGSELIASPTDITDGNWHLNIVSISPGANVIRRNGVQAAANSLDMALAATSGSRRLVIGAARGASAYDVLRLNGMQVAGLWVFDEALHLNATALAVMENYGAAEIDELTA
jgi:hypothetical protein